MRLTSDQQAALGNNLQRLRMRNDLSQREIARFIGRSQTYIYWLEQGRVKSPEISDLDGIMELFGVSLEQLLGPTSSCRVVIDRCDYPEIGRRLKHLRRIPQTDLGRFIDISGATICRLESGYPITLKDYQWAGLAKRLGVTLDYLLHGKSADGMDEDTVREIIHDELEGHNLIDSDGFIDLTFSIQKEVWRDFANAYSGDPSDFINAALKGYRKRKGRK